MQNGKITFVTKQGLQKLQNELDNLINIRRKEVAERIKEAISYGDLSENSEYEDAKNEQAFVEGRIIELQKIIKNAELIDEKNNAQGKKNIIRIGSTVTLKNLTEKETQEYTIVGSTETDPLENKISNESPIGVAILGKSAGEKAEVKVPAGNFAYEILKIK